MEPLPFRISTTGSRGERMILESTVAFVTNPEKMTFVVLSLLTSVVLLLLWKYTNKTWMLYAHLGFALAPMFYFASSINCSLGVIKSLLGYCTAIITKGILYILPLAMAGAFVAGRFQNGIPVKENYWKASHSSNCARRQRLQQSCTCLTRQNL